MVSGDLHKSICVSMNATPLCSNLVPKKSNKLRRLEALGFLLILAEIAVSVHLISRVQSMGMAVELRGRVIQPWNLRSHEWISPPVGGGEIELRMRCVTLRKGMRGTRAAKPSGGMPSKMTWRRLTRSPAFVAQG